MLLLFLGSGLHRCRGSHYRGIGTFIFLGAGINHVSLLFRAILSNVVFDISPCAGLVSPVGEFFYIRPTLDSINSRGTQLCLLFIITCYQQCLGYCRQKD
ncbi:hypothetical protein QBC44DRAFT_30853 [Cladorrhinum sp. PSN332]|nr:hypothetical protein QBC44DRAFT_30853 [Cladorrhinum sp. PSN332]